MSNSTRPQKPRPDFPLFPHRTGRWCKKIRGKFVYFGKVADDPKGEKALEKWLNERDELLSGRRPQARSEGLTIGELCNLWLHAKMALVTTGELAPRTYDDYKRVCELLISTWGRDRSVVSLGPHDFTALRNVMARRWGPTRLGNVIQMIRGLFNWAKAERNIPLPAYGAGFVKPSAKAVRNAKNARSLPMIAPEEIHLLLTVADPITKAAILLAANAGIGPSDLARMPITALDLQTGWADFPRFKTGIKRRFPLWPETIETVEAVLRHRPEARDGYEDHLFLRVRGLPFLSKRGELIGELFRDVAKAAGVEGRGLYDLRRAFQTVSERAGDPVATSSVMGHAPRSGDMAATYRQHIDDDRLRAVVQTVHDWLFAGDHPSVTGRRGSREASTEHLGRRAGKSASCESVKIE
jgi:integrase